MTDEVKTPIAEAVPTDETTPPAESATPPAESVKDESAKTDPPADAPKPEEEEFELELPENSKLTEEDFDEIIAEVEELGLNKDQATKLLAARSKSYEKALSTIEASQKQKQEADRNALINHAEFGGAKLAETIKTIAVPIQKYGDKEFFDFLNGPAGNSPALTRFLLNVSKAMSSDSFDGKGKAQPEKKETSVLETWYPSFYSEKA